MALIDDTSRLNIIQVHICAGCLFFYFKMTLILLCDYKRWGKMAIQPSRLNHIVIYHSRMIEGYIISFFLNVTD